jgi:glyceraldehyde 3-phosphate dehydrogenase
LKYDSVHGRLPADVTVEGEYLVVKRQGFEDKVKVLACKDPKTLPWGALDIDVVFECTGIFTAKDKAVVHLEAGAKRVLVSAPSDGADITVVFGVNHKSITKEHKILSNASCTTNCLAPVAKVLNENFGIKRGYMTTIHSYTGDQKLVDTVHPKDKYRARAGALSMIPTSTGAAKAVGLVLPELNGKLKGSAIRVPTPNVSIVDFKCELEKNTTVEEINAAMKKAASGELNGILGVNELPLVSIDFNHCQNSSTFDVGGTSVIDGNFIRILSWYDNEWGFSNRMSDVAVEIAKTL